MKTSLKIAAAAAAATVVIGAFALMGAGFAQAQGGSPWGGFGMMSGTVTPYPGMGPGMMGGYGMRGTGQGMMAGVDVDAMHAWMTNTGGMHTEMWASLAGALNLTPDELSAQLAAGQTLAQIAEAQGVSQDQLTTVLQSAMADGLKQAVADGVLTQAQADQMLTHMNAQGAAMFANMGAMGGGYGPGRHMITVTPQAVP